MPKEIALDDYAQEALAEYLSAAAAEAEAKAKRIKARETLLALFKMHDADVGLIDGTPVCRLVRSDRDIIDSQRLQAEEPFIYRRFLKPSVAYYIREVRA